MIIVAGTIGAGKSTLTEMLAQDLETKPFYE
ncbi:deoxynucleoside kinase, partial [Enterococcus faecium]|nr:deoxynucleoside kinase [Enterococcus faecium]